MIRMKKVSRVMALARPPISRRYINCMNVDWLGKDCLDKVYLGKVCLDVDCLNVDFPGTYRVYVAPL